VAIGPFGVNEDRNNTGRRNNTGQSEAPGRIRQNIGTTKMDTHFVTTKMDTHFVAIAYRFGALYTNFVGTHAEYDGLDADSVETRTRATHSR